MALVDPPDRIDTVELIEVIACLIIADGNSGPYSTPPSMPMISLVCKEDGQMVKMPLIRTYFLLLKMAGNSK